MRKNDKKKINILQLIASICMLFGCTVNLLHSRIEISDSLNMSVGLSLGVAIILYGIVLVKQIKDRRN